MKNGSKPLLVTLAGALLAFFLLGTALADPPTPAPPPAPPTNSWEDMKTWMDSYWGQGFTDRMHGSQQGMVEGCNTVMGSGAMGSGGMMGNSGMMGNGGMTGSGGMMGNGGTTRSGGMMGSGTRTSGTGYGGMMGTGQLGNGGWGGMMGNFMGGFKARFPLSWF